MLKTEIYTVNENFKIVRKRRGTLIENAHGFYYFLADFNKAKRFDSISLYTLDGTTLHFSHYRTKRHIDTKKSDSGD